MTSLTRNVIDCSVGTCAETCHGRVDEAGKASLLAARATYSFSRRTAVYATIGHIGNDGTLALSVSGGAGGSNPLPGRSQSGFGTGLRHSF